MLLEICIKKTDIYLFLSKEYFNQVTRLMKLVQVQVPVPVRHVQRSSVDLTAVLLRPFYSLTHCRRINNKLNRYLKYISIDTIKIKPLLCKQSSSLIIRFLSLSLSNSLYFSLSLSFIYKGVVFFTMMRPKMPIISLRLP